MILREIEKSPLSGLLLPFSSENLQTYYTRLYTEGGYTYESPLKTIEQMISKIVAITENNFAGPHRMLDIGSGPQYLVHQLLTTYPKLFYGWQINTVDFANIPRQRLMADRFPIVTHWKQSATCLPFLSDHFGLVVSNFALDLMPYKAYCEMARILAPDGIALFHFHYPSPVYTDDPPYWWMRSFVNGISQRYGRPYASKEDIKKELNRVGLAVVDQIGKDSWVNEEGIKIEYWIVSARK